MGQNSRGVVRSSTGSRRHRAGDTPAAGASPAMSVVHSCQLAPKRSLPSEAASSYCRGADPTGEVRCAARVLIAHRAAAAISNTAPTAAAPCTAV